MTSSLNTLSISTKTSIEIDLPGWADYQATIKERLFPLHREIESLYRDLPWPKNVEKIVVQTNTPNGLGDCSTAAKVIAFMQKMAPNLIFDWVISGKCRARDAAPFLNCSDPSKVTIRDWASRPQDETPGDLLILGPAIPSWDLDYIEKRINRKIAGPTFCFLENAAELRTFSSNPKELFVRPSEEADCDYHFLHRVFFPSKTDKYNKTGSMVPMGLQLRSGVFLDKSRIEAPLSCGDCCPSYLPQIQDTELRKDILEAMNIDDGQSQPNYDLYSFNSGYAHYEASWGKFIDSVAIQEKKKHVVIVLSHGHLSAQEFQEQILGKERLAFLKHKDFGNVTFKGPNQNTVHLQQAENSRFLTVIVRRSFTPGDMRHLQLASERLLATGDNSAVEAWCSRCKLYLYEDAASFSQDKWRFLHQQVDLAQKFSPNLSKLLALFGGDKRLPDRALNVPLNSQKMAELELLLNDPELGKATLQFCEHITSNYSFEPVLEGAIKRSVWHHRLPELRQIESETLDEEFRKGLYHYMTLYNKDKVPALLRVSKLPELGKRVRDAVLAIS